MKALSILLFFLASQARATLYQYTVALYSFQGTSPTGIAIDQTGNYPLVVWNGTPTNTTITCSVVGNRALQALATDLSTNSYTWPAGLTTAVKNADYWSVEEWLYLKSNVNAYAVTMGNGSLSSMGLDNLNATPRWCGNTACIAGSVSFTPGICVHMAYVMSRTAGVFSRKIYLGYTGTDSLVASDTTNDAFTNTNFSLSHAIGGGFQLDGYQSDYRVNIYPDNSHVSNTFPSVDPPNPTATPTCTATPTWTNTSTVTPTFTITPSITPTWTNTSTVTPTFTATPTWTHTRTITTTWTNTSTITPTFTATPTWTHTSTVTPTFTATPTYTRTITPTSTASPTRTASPTPTVTATPNCANYGDTAPESFGVYGFPMWSGNRYTLPAGRANLYGLYVNNAGSRIRIALYANSTTCPPNVLNCPGALVTYSGIFTAGAGWNYLTSTATTFSAGDYWLLFQASDYTSRVWGRPGADMFIQRYSPSKPPVFALPSTMIGQGIVYPAKYTFSSYVQVCDY